MKWKIIRNSIKNLLKLEAKLIQNGFKMEPKMRLASWLANWLAGWLADSLAGGSRGSEHTGRWREQVAFGPVGGNLRKGAAGNRHYLAAAGGLLLC